MKRRIIVGKELRNKVSETMHLMASSVQSTLGPSGKLALLDRMDGRSTISKDGVTCARNLLPLEDQAMNVIGGKILEICEKTVSEVGDGTTSAICLARAMYECCIEYMTKDETLDPVVIKEEIEKELPNIIKKLDEMSIPIETLDSMQNVATVSANNDEKVGKVVAKALDMVGEDGFITLEEGDTIEPKMTLVEGFQIDKGASDIRYLKGKSSIKLNNPYFLVVNGRIDDPHIIYGIADSYLNGRPLVIVSEISPSVQKWLLHNVAVGSFEVVHIPPSMYKNTRQKYLKDLAIAVGAELIDPSGQHLASIKKEQLGQSDSVTVGQYTSNVVKGKGNKESILQRVEEIKQEISESKSKHDISTCKERIGKLVSGVCILSVGGKTEQEMKERKDRFDDSLNATRAALQEGIVAGGGYALYTISKKLKSHSTGSKILRQVIKEPIKQIVRNTGLNPDEILKQVDELGKGYNAKSHEYCDLVQTGIIDPVKVTKMALQNAVSIVDLLINLEVLSYHVKPDQPDLSQLLGGPEVDLEN